MILAQASEAQGGTGGGTWLFRPTVSPMHAEAISMANSSFLLRRSEENRPVFRASWRARGCTSRGPPPLRSILGQRQFENCYGILDKPSQHTPSCFGQKSCSKRLPLHFLRSTAAVHAGGRLPASDLCSRATPHLHIFVPTYLPITNKKTREDARILVKFAGFIEQAYSLVDLFSNA